MNEQKQPLVQNFEYLQSSPQVCTVNFSLVITFLNIKDTGFDKREVDATHV